MTESHDESASSRCAFRDTRRRILKITVGRIFSVLLASILVATLVQWRWTGQAPRAVFKFEGRENVFRHDISGDGRLAFTWSNFPDLAPPLFRVWDANSQGSLQELWSTPVGESDVIVPSPDLATLAFFDAYPQAKLVLLNPFDGKLLAEWVSPHQPTRDSPFPVRHEITWSPTGKHVAVWGNDHSLVKRVYVLTLPELKLEVSLPDSSRPTFAPDGMQLVAQQLKEGAESENHSSFDRVGWSIWNLKTGRKELFIREASSGHFAMPSRDAMSLVIGDDIRDVENASPGVRLVDPLNGEHVADYPDARLVTLSTDGEWLLTQEEGSMFVVRDAMTGRERWRRQLKDVSIQQIVAINNSRFPFAGILESGPGSEQLALTALDESGVIQTLPSGGLGRLKFTADFHRMAELVTRGTPAVTLKGKRIAVYDLPPTTNWGLLWMWSLGIALGAVIIVEIARLNLVSRLSGDPLFPGWK